MAPPSLQGRSILIVEDEPLIVLDITQALENAGAAVTSTNTLKHALLLVEHDGLSAAILDHALGNDKSTLLYKRLKERGIPFLIHSGYPQVEGVPDGISYVSKPATPEAMVEAVEGLIRNADAAHASIA
jgi:DNA-binding response OmpR family regulator